VTDPDVTADASGTGSTPLPASDPLVIRSLDFDGPMTAVDGWRPPPRLPEIAFAGRSNVGKSSLLNALVRRKAFARVSRTPGRTREINFFRVNDAFMLVDLPGYGYAKISKERKLAWRPLIASYLRGSPYLRGVVQLLDVRHDPTEDDRVMLDFLAEIGVPTLIAVTKVDKLSAQARAKRIAALCAAYGVDEAQVIPFSAHAGIGRDDLAASVLALLAAGPWRAEPVSGLDPGVDQGVRDLEKNDDAG
jgi:GTP-binding protein